MLNLLLDSSDKNLAVGFAKDEEILGSIVYEAWQKQSEFMVDEIDKLMSKLAIKKEDIDGVVVSKGPGSYTGVRIALTIAKTISFALNIPLYLVNSLEVLQQIGHPSICLMNARGKRSYFAVYNSEKNVQDCIKTNAEVMDFIHQHPDYSVCGDVAYLGLESLQNPVISNLAYFAKPEYRCEEPLGARPIYLKDDYDEGRFKTVVRKMMPSDVEAVLAIEQEAFKHPYGREALLFEMNENPVAYLYCAVVDNEVVGMIDFYITFNSCTIAQIAVKENFRSKGIGNRLIGQMLKDCESKSDPVEYATLEVRVSNVRAQKFYKRHKFEPVTTKHAYYDDGEDAVYMVRSLING